MGQLRHGVVRKGDPHVLGAQKRGVLARERVLRLGQDPPEILLAEGIELDADGQAALKLGDQVGGFGDVKGARRDK